MLEQDLKLDNILRNFPDKYLKYFNHRNNHNFNSISISILDFSNFQQTSFENKLT